MNKAKLEILTILLLFISFKSIIAQRTGVNTTTPDVSAQLEISSTTLGFLPPRMTETQRNAIIDPATGLLIYNITSKCYEVNIGTPAVPNWQCMISNLTNDDDGDGVANALDSDPADCTVPNSNGCPVQITFLDCHAATVSGIIYSGVPVTETASILYAGGNGVAYPAGAPINSTGVTGLIATLQAGTLATGLGSLIFDISGTAATTGTALFEVSFGGQTCILSVQVETLPAHITGLDCSSATSSGNVTVGLPASVTTDVPYTGGNGIAYPTGSPIASTGVTGLTATLQAGTLATGAGNFTYDITGTPASTGTASFAIDFDGQSCSLDITVETLPLARIGYVFSFSIGSSELANYKTQLSDLSNYGTSGTYNKISGFTFTSLTAGSITDAATLKANFDIISTGYSSLTNAQANILKQYVDLGGIVIVLLDSTLGTSLHLAFGGTGSIGSGTISSITNTNPINSGVFGSGSNVTINGSGSYGAITASQLPPGAITLSTSGANPRTWITGTGNKAIFVWDEGVFRNVIVTGVIDTPQEVWLHNLMAYALDQAGF